MINGKVTDLFVKLNTGEKGKGKFSMSLDGKEIYLFNETRKAISMTDLQSQPVEYHLINGNFSWHTAIYAMNEDELTVIVEGSDFPDLPQADLPEQDGDSATVEILEAEIKLNTQKVRVPLPWSTTEFTEKVEELLDGEAITSIDIDFYNGQCSSSSAINELLNTLVANIDAETGLKELKLLGLPSASMLNL